MRRATLTSSLAICFLLGLTAPLLAAGTSTGGTANQPPDESASAAKAAGQCLTDLRVFNDQMQKDGYWLDYGAADPGLAGYDDGYGYPLGGYGLGNYPAGVGGGYIDARPGYEVRVLLATINILARHGQQQLCEDVLAATRDHYQQYIANMERAGMQMANVPGWQRQQIAAAQPVSTATTSFRSDQLLGTTVRNSNNVALGSVDDLVTSPETGKIVYLVVARGGIFGIGAKQVAVPWEDFKVSPNAALLVLNATPDAMDAAPQASSDELTKPGEKSQAVDGYWKALLPNGTNG